MVRSPSSSSHAPRAPASSSTAIVVLGAPLAPGDRLSTVLAERVDAAVALHAELATADAAPLVVATGGTTRGASRAEADVIAEALAARGIPDVLVERASLTTEDNARHTAAILLPLGVRRVWIVTQPFHARRAAWLFREAGFDAHAHRIVDSVQYRSQWRSLKWNARESAAWMKLLASRARTWWRRRA